MTQRFEGQVALITGAASGMGRATALRMGSEGAQVYCADINVDGARATAQDICAAGGQAAASGTDISDPLKARALVEDVVKTFGKLTILCNIAGVGAVKTLADETPEGWARHFAVNANAPFFLSQAAMPQLVEHRGNIVNISSTAGLKGQIYMVSYCASKHALIGLTKALAVEFGRKGVRVNAVCPGGTKTPFLKGFAFPDDAELDLVGRLAVIEEMADPADIANTICFVASDEARFMNGSVLSVDGGAVAC